MFESIGVVNISAFALASLLIVLCPGPNSLFVLRTAIASGARTAFAAACGVFLGDTILMLATYLGVAAVIMANPTLLKILQCAGAAYLSYLAIGILSRVLRPKTSSVPKSEAPSGPSKTTATATLPKRQAFRTALVLSLSNPKAILFTFSFFLPFIDPSKGHAGLAFLTLSVILQFWSVCYLSTLCRTGPLLFRFFGSRPTAGKIGNVAIAVLFLFFAYELVFGA